MTAIPEHVQYVEKWILIICGSFNVLFCATALAFQLTHRQMIRKSGIFPFMVNLLLAVEGIILFLTGFESNIGPTNTDSEIPLLCKISSGVDQSIYVACILYINFYATFVSSITKSCYIEAKKYIKLYHILVALITALYVLGFYMLPNLLFWLNPNKDIDHYRTAGYDVAGLCRIENNKNVNSILFVVYTTLPFWVTLVWGIVNVVKLYGFVPTMHKKQLKTLLHIYIVFYLSFIFISSINPLINFVVEVKCYGLLDYKKCSSGIDQNAVLKYVVVAASGFTGVVVALNILLQRYVLHKLFRCLRNKHNGTEALNNPLRNDLVDEYTDEIIAFMQIAKNQSYFTIHTILMSICYILEKVFNSKAENSITPQFDYVQELNLSKDESEQLPYRTQYYIDSEMKASIIIKVYAPDAFRLLFRQNETRTVLEFIKSLSPLSNEELLDSTRMKFGSGKSSSLFFTTADKKLIVKTASLYEIENLRHKFLPHCFQHIFRNADDNPFIRYYMGVTINVK